MFDTPVFVSEELAKEVVFFVISSLRNSVGTLRSKFGVAGNGLHVVVVVPGRRPHCTSPDDERLYPHQLCEYSLRSEEWRYPLAEIARSKALQLWRGQNEGRTDTMPHLLFKGDTPFWGGVKRDGIVVSCSGLEPCYDRMIAGMVADMIIALAYGAWAASEERKKDASFL